MNPFWRRSVRAVLALLLICAAAVSAAELSKELQDKLASSTYVYISSQRKSGELGKPAEIWFYYGDGAVWVASPPTAWRVRRILAGRKNARIAVGSVGGPSFMATGEIVKSPAMEDRLLAAYAKKYPEGWKKFEDNFRKGFADGSRLLIRYTPKG